MSRLKEIARKAQGAALTVISGTNDDHDVIMITIAALLRYLAKANGLSMQTALRRLEDAYRFLDKAADTVASRGN